jgi:hypothetical protein
VECYPREPIAACNGLLKLIPAQIRFRFSEATGCLIAPGDTQALAMDAGIAAKGTALPVLIQHHRERIAVLLALSHLRRPLFG